MTLFRIPPALPAAEMKTYQIISPADTEIRAACAQVGCTAWRYGWESHIDESTSLGQTQAAYIRTESGRTFREMRTAAGLTVFVFEPGQRCFAEHRTRPERYIERGGDWRGNPRGEHRQHRRAEDWVESFGEHQQNLSDVLDAG